MAEEEMMALVQSALVAREIEDAVVAAGQFNSRRPTVTHSEAAIERLSG
jgi:hypothetical protein